MTLKQEIHSITLIPSGGGAFEVKVDDALIYSKLSTGTFPDFDQMVTEVRANL